MTLNDLRLFVAAARHGSLVLAGDACHVTPSAVSRAIQRLETELRTPLFDRVGKGLKLNDAGGRLRKRALDLLTLTEQTKADFAGAGYRVRCRVVAPPLLLRLYGTTLAASLADRHADSSVTFETAFEGQAAIAVAQGASDFALVTEDVVRDGTLATYRELEAVPLGSMVMQLAAAPTHPVVRQIGPRRCTSDMLLAESDFACPTRSPFCGRKRGVGSDGWQDGELPRRIRYWTDDLQVLIELVQSGRALAYLPEQLLAPAGLVRIRIEDCPFVCEERALLLWRPGLANGWQRSVVDDLKRGFDDSTPAHEAVPRAHSAFT